MLISKRNNPVSTAGYAWLLSTLLLFASVSLAKDSMPTRVVSINLCTDQLAVMLADPGQIASLSYLARDPESSFVAREARAFPFNHARSEELIKLEPDLVLAGSYSDPRLLRVLREFAIPVHQFPLTYSLSGIEADIRRMAELLGQKTRGEQLIKTMQTRLERIAQKSQTTPPPKALFYQPRGFTSGSQTLQDEALRLAGWRNLAAETGIEGYAQIDLESMLLAEPDRLFTSGHSAKAYSRAQQQLRHPALKLILRGSPPQEIPFKYWFCAGPMIADAVELLWTAHGQ